MQLSVNIIEVVIILKTTIKQGDSNSEVIICFIINVSYQQISELYLKSFGNTRPSIQIYEAAKCQKVSEYDQEIPHSHTADQPKAPWEATEH